MCVTWHFPDPEMKTQYTTLVLVQTTGIQHSRCELKLTHLWNYYTGRQGQFKSLVHPAQNKFEGPKRCSPEMTV